MKKTLLFVFTISLWGCDYYDDSLSVVNHSKIQIVVEESNHSHDIFFNNIEYYLSNIIEPDSLKSLTISGKEGAWKRHIKISPEKRIFIYIFDVDTLSKYKGKKTMYDLYAQEKYIKRFEYSEQQLNNIHWKVVFKQ